MRKPGRLDRDFGGVEEGRVGPVENKLLSIPIAQFIVFGRFGEASEAVHSLVEDLATSSQNAWATEGEEGCGQVRGGGEVHRCWIYQEDTLPGWTLSLAGERKATALDQPQDNCELDLKYNVGDYIITVKLNSHKSQKFTSFY